MLPLFQYVVDKSGDKGKFGVWLRVRKKLVERPFICLGQYEEILKRYIFTKKMWNHKDKCQLFPKDYGYSITITDFQSK